MRARSLLAALVVVFALLAAAGCGGSDGTSDDPVRDTSATSERDSDVEAADEGEESHEEHDDDGDEPAEPTKLPEPVPAGEQPPIVVRTPAPFQELVGAFVLSGSAQVHEGTLAWAILDATLEPMVTGRMTASCGAPCRGTYRTRISLARVPVGSWELHVWSPNVADEGAARLHDTMVPVTVARQRTPGAPAPGTVPPGGAPQG